MFNGLRVKSLGVRREVSRRHAAHSSFCFCHQSAAVGTACAGQLYFSAFFTVALILGLLRFGPRQRSFDDEEEDEEEYLDYGEGTHRGSSLATVAIASGTPDNLSNEALDSSELQPLKRHDLASVSSSAARKRKSAASLSGML